MIVTYFDYEMIAAVSNKREKNDMQINLFKAEVIIEKIKAK